MKQILLSLLLSLAAATTAQAQARPASADMTVGEIRKVDKDTARLTIRHAEIKSLDMPAMTMVFHVRDQSVLDQLKAGDPVRFKAVHDGGQYTVTEIEVLR